MLPLIKYSSKKISTGLSEALLAMSVSYSYGVYQIDFPQLDRKVYAEFKTLFPLIRGFWNGKTHLCQYDPTDLFFEISTKGYLPEANPGAFFPTPNTSCLDLIEYVNLPTYESVDVLEPNGGTGNIIDAILSVNSEAKIDTFELDPINRLVLENKNCNVIGEDFLKESTDKLYDFVLMNPPFQSSAYVSHINRAFKRLKPNGVLGAIIPEGFLTSTQKNVVEFRNLVSEYGDWCLIGSPFEGTKVKCYQIKIQNTEPVHLWAEHSGYPSYFCYDAMMYLSCDSSFYQFVESAVERQHEHGYEDFLSLKLDSFVKSWIKEGNCILWNDKVKSQVLTEVKDQIKNFG